MSIHGELFVNNRDTRIICRCERCGTPYFLHPSITTQASIRFCRGCIASNVVRKGRKRRVEGEVYGPRAGYVGACYEYRTHFAVEWDLGLSGPSKTKIIFVDGMYAEHASEFSGMADIVITYPTFKMHPLKAKNVWTISRARTIPAIFNRHAKYVEQSSDNLDVPFWDLIDYAYKFNRDDPALFKESVNARSAYAFRTETARYVQMDGELSSFWFGRGSESYYAPYLLQKVLANEDPSAILCPVKEANRNSRIAREMMQRATRIDNYVKNRSSLLDE